MKLQKQRDFLVTCAYWAVIAAAIYLGFEYLVPISVPFLLGIPIAYLIVRISRLLHCSHRLLRIGLTVLIYGVLGLLITLMITKGISTITSIIKFALSAPRSSTIAAFSVMRSSLTLSWSRMYFLTVSKTCFLSIVILSFCLIPRSDP